MAVVAAVATSVAVSAGTAIAAGKSKRRARRQAKGKEAELRNLENNRQKIINPYENVKDLSSMVNNPFANLQVATKAAEIQAEEADISLANTLDTLRATGGGAANATALAQAALRSKQGISATIEQQEADNAKARAQGEARMQQMKMAEAQRIQQADVAGKQFMFGVREDREMQRMNRVAGQAQQARSNEASARASQYGALGSLAGSVMSFAGSDTAASIG